MPKFSTIALLIGYAQGQDFSPIQLSSARLMPLDIDQAMITERNQQIDQITQDLADLLTIQNSMYETLNIQDENLSQAEENVTHAVQYATESIPIIQDAQELQHSNLWQRFLLRTGIPIGTSAAAGAGGFLATKAVILTTPLALAPAAPIAIPVTAAVTLGTITFIGGKLLMNKLVK